MLFVKWYEEGYLMKTAQTNKDKIWCRELQKTVLLPTPYGAQTSIFFDKELSKVDPMSLEYEALGEIDLSIGKRVAHIVTNVNKPRSVKFYAVMFL